jgi:hypothetical protein
MLPVLVRPTGRSRVMHGTTRAPDDFHLRVVVDRLAREGRSQREIEEIVGRLAPQIARPERRSLPAMVRRLVSA